MFLGIKLIRMVCAHCLAPTHWVLLPILLDDGATHVLQTASANQTGALVGNECGIDPTSATLLSVS